MKKLNWVLGLALGGVMAVGGVALAKAGGRHAGGPVVARLGQLMGHLELNEEQEERLFRIQYTLHQRKKDRRATHKQKKAAVAAELKKQEPDRAMLKGLIQDRLKAMQEDAEFALDEFLVIHRSLTPEQREKLSTLAMKRGHRGHSPH